MAMILGSRFAEATERITAFRACGAKAAMPQGHNVPASHALAGQESRHDQIEDVGLEIHDAAGPEFEVQRHTPDALLRRIAELHRCNANTHRYTI